MINTDKSGNYISQFFIALLVTAVPNLLWGVVGCILSLMAGIMVPMMIWERRAKDARRLMNAWRLVQHREDAALLAVEARLKLNERERRAA